MTDTEISDTMQSAPVYIILPAYGMETLHKRCPYGWVLDFGQGRQERAVLTCSLVASRWNIAGMLTCTRIDFVAAFSSLPVLALLPADGKLSLVSSAVGPTTWLYCVML